MEDHPLHNPYENTESPQTHEPPPAAPAQSSGEYHYSGEQIQDSYTTYYGGAEVPGGNPTQAQGEPVYRQQSSRSYSSPHTPRMATTQPQGYTYSQYGRQWPDDHNQHKNGRKGISFLSIIAIVLVCAIAGFGGGALAYELMGQQEPSVIYQAPSSGADNTSYIASGDYSEIVSKIKPSVVSIITGTLVGGLIPTEGAGSGVIITEDGYIITNHHVIDGARTIRVILDDGSEFTGTLVGSDQKTDVAVVKINVTGLTPATIGNSDNLREGQLCLAVGNPMGNLGGTVTDGIISALSREITIDNQAMTLLQMSAAVSPGNSGGGLFNINGDLIGVVNAKSAGENAEGLGFAIPINTAISIAEQLIQSGSISRPALGVYVRTFTTDDEAIAYDFEKAGIYIVQVNMGGSAEAAGLQVGDRIVKFNGETITSGSALSKALESLKVGDTVDIIVERNGEMLTIAVTLKEAVDTAFNEGNNNENNTPSMPTYP